jgi:hypothetical protein
MDYCGPRALPLHQFLAWPQESQDAALAWAASERSRCGNCGTHREDWANGARPQHWHDEICPGCQEKQKAIQLMQADKDDTKGVVLVAADGPRTTCPACNV